MADVVHTIFDRANWFMRRRYLYAVTGFVMAMMLIACFGPVEPTVAQTIVANGFWVLAAFTGTYVFGAVWDHTNQRKFGITNEPGTVTKATTVTEEITNAPASA